MATWCTRIHCMDGWGCVNQIRHAGARSIDQGDDLEFGFNTAVRGFHVDRRVWLPHFEQLLRAEREHGIAKDRLQCLSDEKDCADSWSRCVIFHYLAVSAVVCSYCSIAPGLAGDNDCD